MTPKIYLISRNLTQEQVSKIREALSITPLQTIIVADARDVDGARPFCEAVTGLSEPIAIFADFENPLTALSLDGTLCPIQL